MFPDFPPPLFQRKGRIRQHTIMGGKSAAGWVEESRMAQGVPLQDGKVVNAVQEQVHAGDRSGGHILLLPEELAKKGARIAASLLHMGNHSQQHTRCAASRIVDAFPLMWVQNVHHQPHHATGV